MTIANNIKTNIHKLKELKKYLKFVEEQFHFIYKSLVDTWNQDHKNMMGRVVKYAIIYTWDDEYYNKTKDPGMLIDDFFCKIYYKLLPSKYKFFLN